MPSKRTRENSLPPGAPNKRTRPLLPRKCKAELQEGGEEKRLAFVEANKRIRHYYTVHEPSNHSQQSGNLGFRMHHTSACCVLRYVCDESGVWQYHPKDYAPALPAGAKVISPARFPAAGAQKYSVRFRAFTAKLSLPTPPVSFAQESAAWSLMAFVGIKNAGHAYRTGDEAFALYSPTGALCAFDKKTLKPGNKALNFNDVQTPYVNKSFSVMGNRPRASMPKWRAPDVLDVSGTAGDPGDTPVYRKTGRVERCHVRGRGCHGDSVLKAGASAGNTAQLVLLERQIQSAGAKISVSCLSPPLRSEGLWSREERLREQHSFPFHAMRHTVDVDNETGPKKVVDYIGVDFPEASANKNMEVFAKCVLGPKYGKRYVSEGSENPPSQYKPNNSLFSTPVPAKTGTPSPVSVIGRRSEGPAAPDDKENKRPLVRCGLFATPNKQRRVNSAEGPDSRSPFI